MKTFLLQWLRCPSCASTFRMFPDPSRAETELLEGELVCGNRHRFPITRGVPRLLSENSWTRKDGQTQAVFGYEWSRFSAYHVPNFRTLIVPQPETWFPGKRGLDVGCGAGRHLLEATRAGAEMIGVDPSEAVEVARERLVGVAHADVVQADLRHLPFQPHSFDFVYSWGVLHHLPDPETAFHRLLPYLKPGGLVVIGVYQVTLRKRLLELPRLVTTRLPLSLARAVAWSAAVVDYYGLIMPFRWAARGFGSAVDRFVPSHIREYARYPFHVSQTDWFDRLTAPITHWYRREEVLGWFLRAKLTDIRLEPIGDFRWRGEARVAS